MKLQSISLAAILFFAVATKAQTDSSAAKGSGEDEIKTIFGSGEVKHGGYGAASIYLTEIQDKSAILIGGRGGWIINHSMVIGLGGYGIANAPQYDNIFDDNKGQLYGGYGGLLFEGILFPKSPIHVSIPVLVGAGGVSYSELRRSRGVDFDDEFYRDSFYSDAFFVVEPGIEIEANVIKYFRFGIGVNYRYTADLELPNTSSDMLDGFSAGVVLKFGKF